MRTALGVDSVCRAVDQHQLAVELVEGADAEITVLAQFADRRVSVVDAVHHCADRRGLKGLIVEPEVLV